MCIGGEALPSSLSVLITLRSVLTGSSEPLGRMARLVCCMYYTDVFVGHNNDINNLKSALKAELKGFNVNSNALTQLVHGLCLFMGYPSCVCSLKLNVDKSLKDISKKLLKDFEAVQSSHSNLTLNLNCSNCNSNEILCKCCVISCIKAVKKCKCVKKSSNSCQCKDPNGKCCKDFLSGLEACLSLLNLQTDLKDCNCDGPDCCKNGTCNKSCDLCSPQKFPDNAMTGLGICPMNPRKLAEKLDGYFKPKTSKSCGCKCGTSKESCCCLACPDTAKCSSKKSCFCLNGSQCSCASKLKLPKTSGDCPRKTFCEAIQNVKLLANSSEMTCCSKGEKCHCSLAGSGSKCSGSNCCVEKDTSGAGSDHYQHSVKCMILRVVKFFKDFPLDSSVSSSQNCSKLCCELICVGKTCEFLKTFYDKGGKKCSKCNGGPQKNCKGSTLKPPGSSSTSCCRGNISTCSRSDCCLGCLDCDAIKFSRALETLKYSGPCGLDLYRLLDDLLNFIRNVMAPNQDFIRDTVLKAVKGCSKCKKSGTNSSTWSACGCSSSSNCLACTSLLQDSKLMSILRHGYVSSYTYKFESYFDPPAKSTYASWNSLSQGEQKKAAKIFLGFLPCLYYGLKILHARSKYGSGFAGWHDITMDSKGLPSSDLAKFLYAWGYDLRPLKSKKGSEFFSLLENLFGSDSSGPLQKLSTLVTEKYFTSHLISPPKDPKTPSTVRSMLLWLYGLPYTSGFHDLVSRCKDLCSPFENSFHPDAFCYYIYTCCFLLPVAIISLIEDS
ncbi:variant erythrocyte surface antigen-1 family protein, partial [Babesia divergens]